MLKKYSSPQIIFHWVTVFLLIVAYATIELRWLAEKGTWQRSAIIVTHFSAGFCVMLVMAVRLYLRTRYKTPQILPPAQRWQTGLSHLAHSCIYTLFIVLPLLGICSRYFRGKEWWLFGLSMPVSDNPAPELAETLIGWHETLAPLGYWLIGLHALAALFHHYILRDNTLTRMMP
ncbi:Cytochrome B561 [Erwinia sp. Ejp617]|nr:cytochrome b561 [Erwinia sp. Ejp617]ADP10697.1 Cytochrome B561 [Erwinia sp. Ejp617]